MLGVKYEPKKIDKDFNSNSFISYYKKYIDVTLFNSDRVLFCNILGKIRKYFFDNVKTLNKDTLFICDQNVNKMTFLSAFSTLNRLVTNRYFNMLNLVDIWCKNADWTNKRLDDSDAFSSEQDILDDVLCIFIDKNMYTTKMSGKVINTVVVSRNNKLNSRREKLVTWVFFYGSPSDIINNENINNIYNLFSTRSGDCQIIDLSSCLKGFEIKGKNNTIISPLEAKSLDDVY